MDKLELLGLFPQELGEALADMKLPAYRVKQLFSWLHRGARFEEMTNISKPLRETLAQNYADQPVSLLEQRVSRLDGTRKLLYALRDGNCAERELMHYHHGYTLCLSTQVGCRMGCAFCASTLNGCVRSLSAAEMLGQVHCANRLIADDHISNIVLMGSGEPLDNYDNVTRFLRLVSHPDGLNIGLRHISLSTCGLVPQMKRFAREGLPVTLSLSLHAPNDTIRRQLMPVANAFAMEDVLDACRYYIEQTGRRVIFEYALVGGVNCEERHARELLRVHGEDQRLAVIEELSRRNFSVAQTARYIDTLETQSAISGSARYRRRETRLVLERVARDAALLRVAGVPAQIQRQDTPDEIVLTLRISAP